PVMTLDGSEDFKIVSNAVAASAYHRNGASRFVIYVKASVCRIQGLYVHSQRQFIYGAVDFIFDDTIAVLRSCNMRNHKDIVTVRPQQEHGHIDPLLRLQDLPRPAMAEVLEGPSS
ncbi:hypothetical protein BHM03_00045277, partial [Ensete ventricosum]